MRVLIKRFNKLRQRYFPTAQDIASKPVRDALERWRADKGDQTLRLAYNLDSESVVMDLGGYQGAWAHDINMRYGCSIHIFEPVPQFADQIDERFKAQDNIRVYRYGLGEKTRRDTIGLSADGSSLHHRKDTQVAVEVVDVADWFAQHSEGSIDLLKINIEGGEYELLERMIETGLASRVHNIQVQFHNISADSERWMGSILERLAKTHQPTYQYKFVWENWQLR